MLIAQISDTHVTPDRPQRSGDLRAVVKAINSLAEQPDVVVHSGDITHDGSAAQYEAARAVLDDLRAPLYVMPGNRDRRPALLAAFADHGYLKPDMPFVQFALESFPVRLICLDSVSRSTKGDLCQRRLADMDELLGLDAERPAAIFMHHPPFDVTCASDPFQFESRNAVRLFAATLKRHQHVAAVFCGHVHREAQGSVEGVPARTMASVAVDLRFGSYAPDHAATPLFQLHRYGPDAGFTTRSLPAI